ncbi:MAG: DUF1285 domain-containing protein [Rhizobiales bacterium]|nr:DUF1285 domain-containing protein [Hyphomicrobiales bacterium]
MSDILSDLATKLGENSSVGFAPVESWNPQYCGEIDIEIKENGDWYHMGSQIKRPKLVALFASVLWRDVDGDGAHYLITPAEKIKIKVKDSAFIATDLLVDVQNQLQNIAVQTNLAGQVLIGRHNPIRFTHDDGQFMAYVTIRYGLEAKLTRSLCYDLAEYMTEKDGSFILMSNNQQFRV